MGWIIFGEAQHNNVTMTSKYAPDLSRDAFHVWLSKYHWVPLTAMGLGLWALGGWNWVLWGVFLRTTLGLHATWLVNSATHLWGKRRFMTRDDSRNNWWVAILTFGEAGTQSHAHPTSAAHGLAWYEVDLTYLHIRALELCGWPRTSAASGGDEPSKKLRRSSLTRRVTARDGRINSCRVCNRARGAIAFFASRVRWWPQPWRSTSAGLSRTGPRRCAARRYSGVCRNHHRTDPQHHVPGPRDPSQRTTGRLPQLSDA